jgi:hypothetical protein
MNKQRVGLAIMIIAAYTVSVAAQVTGSGTSGTVPVFTGTSTVGNSPIAVSGNNVGIGTVAPAGTLQIISTGAASLYMTNSRIPESSWRFVVDNSGTFWIQESASSGGMSLSNPFQISAGGNVGITGASLAPQAKLHVGGYTSTGEVIRVTNGYPAANNNTAGIMFNLNNSSSTLVNVAEVKGVITNINSSAYAGALTFLTSSNAAPAERMRIDNLGNVGIGTTSPAQKLDVAGNVKLTGTGASIYFPDGSIQSTAYTGVICGGDYAESVDVTGDRTKYEPGDVLVIDPSAPGKFLKSAEPYSTSVTGVYSTKPGTVGRRQTTPRTAEEVPMAMVGIVPTKVSAENGPIKVGDLLVTSSTPGYAMKGTDRSRMLGAVVGKAMANLDSGTGVIEVLVSLQ